MYKLMLVLFNLLFISSQLWSKNLSSDPGFAHEVLFTNPQCQPYIYESHLRVRNRKGEEISGKTQNSYCSKDDLAHNLQHGVVHTKLMQLLSQKNIKSIFVNSLSFSNEDVMKKLCELGKSSVQVTLVIDLNNTDNKLALDLKECDNTQVYFLGQTGGFGFFHNKLMLIDYKENKTHRDIVYSSANLSTGTTMHHENWNFMTVAKNSHFNLKHDCLKEAILKQVSYTKKSKAKFIRFIESCVAKINSPEEKDYQFYIVPSEGEKLLEHFKLLGQTSDEINFTTHRFTHPEISKTLTDAAQNGAKVKALFDDDLYWMGQLDRNRVGVSMKFETYRVFDLIRGGASIKYLETNERNFFFLHNKFTIFMNSHGGSVQMGAGNYTKSAFTKNFENYYITSNPNVVRLFKDQFDYLYDQLGLMYEEMPTEYVSSFQ